MNYQLPIINYHWRLSVILQWYIILIAAILQFGCANESVPQGGKKDEIPPEAKKIEPENKTLRFRSNKIQITFNEYLKETGFGQTLISPPMDKQPDIRVSGKTVTIKLKSRLRDSTTYTINFADDIQDVNEGNKASNFTYVFSTGDYIDSQQVFGKVILAKDNTPGEEVVVALYPVDSVDGILRGKPFYFAKTDKSGQFEINNLQAGKYHVYALKDQNYNYLYDQPNELIAFSDSILDLNDSISESITLYLFEESAWKLNLNEVRTMAPGFLQISYSKPIKTFKLNGELFSEGDIAWLYDTNDTINYWYSIYYINKTDLFLVANDSIMDTVRMELKFIEKDSLFINNRNLLSIVNQPITGKEKPEMTDSWNIQELYKPVKINFSRPVININESKRLQITQDSTDKITDSKFTLDEKTKQFISVDFDKRENTAYSLEIPDSIFQDIFGTWNKKTIYEFRTNNKDAYGNLRITLKTDHPENYYIVRLLNASNEVMKEFLFTGNGERKVSVENALSGSYKFLVIDDVNRNGKWDTGNFKEKIQPEKMFTYKDTYQLKGGWDLEVEVKF